MAEGGLRRGSITVVAECEPEKICPIWKDLQATGRVEAVVGLEALAMGAAGIPVGHPANLTEAFPRARDLNRVLGGIAITSFSAAVALGAIIFSAEIQLKAEYTTECAHAADLQGQLKNLNGNRLEMDRLRKEAPEEAGGLPLGRHKELVELASAIPDTLTLTSLVIGSDGGFEFEALIVGADFDPENTRLALARRGFVSATDKGWMYDAASGTLLVRGQYGEVRQ